MAEIKETAFTDSGYRPGRALSPEDYSGGFVDFYKDYLGTTGIKTTTPVDEEEEKDKKDTPPNIFGVQEDSGDDSVNLLSAVFSKQGNNSLGTAKTYYDAKVEAVDLQSMDLSHGSWDAYKKATQTSDKSVFGKDFAIGTAALVNPVVGLGASAILGEPVTTPWGVENHGAGIVKPIGNYTASLKNDALMDMKAIGGMYDMADDPENMGMGSMTRKDVDIGDVIKIDGEFLVRPRGSTQFIGTLPVGMTNQKALNLAAIKNGKLPSYIGGIGTEDGFGIGGLGGYTKDGFFTDANGVQSAYGSLAARDQLAAKEFDGNKDAADQWLKEVRAGRGLLGGDMTIEKATQIKQKIQRQFGVLTTDISGSSVIPAGKYGTYNLGIGFEDVPDDRTTTIGRTGVQTKQLPLMGPMNLGFEDVPDDDRFTQFNITGQDRGLGLAGEEEPEETTIAGVLGGGADLAAGRRGTAVTGYDFNLGGPNRTTPTKIQTGRYGSRGTKPIPLGGLVQSPSSIFQDLVNNRGFTNKQAVDLLNTIIPERSSTFAGNVDRGVPEVIPASFTVADSGDDTTITEDQIQAETEMGLDPFGGAGEPVQNDTSGSDDKIVCTAMNNAYGFGSFRQTVWLNHSRNLDPAYQKGYHRIFRPLVKLAYNNNTVLSNLVKNWLEGVARRRTADIWAEKRGKQRKLFSKIERSILEPICYIIGKL